MYQITLYHATKSVCDNRDNIVIVYHVSVSLETAAEQGSVGAQCVRIAFVRFKGIVQPNYAYIKIYIMNFGARIYHLFFTNYLRSTTAKFRLAKVRMLD